MQSFDNRTSLELDQLVIDIEQAEQKGLQGIAARLKEKKHKIEAFIFEGGPKPRKARKLDYYVYIQSEEWRERAEQFKRMAGYRCQVCNRGRNEVILTAHHRTYERLGAELREDITILCTDCHGLFEAQKRNSGDG